MFTEAELVPISALQHLLFCERQAALIHVERLWAENRLTIEGRALHTRVHGERAGPRGGGLRARRGNATVAASVQLRSLHWGIYGVADRVEFQPPSGATSVDAVDQSTRQPFPVEFKRGRPKKHDADRVQLCAQALCLEEMLDTTVLAGAIFYGKTKRREQVAFDAALREQTTAAITRMHELIRTGATPVARREKKCDRCSLLNLCLPHVTGLRRSAATFVQREIQTSLSNSLPPAGDAGAPTP